MQAISVIIPTLNRAVSLERTLLSIAKIVKPTDPVEIIVVDNGSIDETASMCRQLVDYVAYLDLRYYYDDMPGLLTRRQRGARQAKGDVLAYLDDDVVLAPTWLESLEDAFCDPKVV